MVDNFELLVNESKIQEILSKLQEQFQVETFNYRLPTAFYLQYFEAFKKMKENKKQEKQAEE